MLSISPIRAGEQVNYYSKLGEAENHDYYSDDGDRPGTWWGEGAQCVGLKGDVQAEAFRNILDGKNPDGTESWVQARNGNQLKRRAGFDLTFTVPKSYSVAWAQADRATRDKLDELAERALLRTLDELQEHCGNTRRGKDGLVTEQAKLIAAIFKHDTARGIPGELPDCNLHHHVVLANLVVREDGSTGALDARPLFQRRAKMTLGAMYRAELSKLLETELGLATHRPNREGREDLASWWELDCVPNAVCESFSKRRREIEKWLRKHGVSGAAASEKAALQTRKTKEQVSASELFKAWRKEGRSLGFSWNELQAELRNATPSNFNRKVESEKALRRGLAALMENAATFTNWELLERVAVEAQTRGVGIDEIRASVESCLADSSEIVRLKDPDRGQRRFTTKEMLALERRMLARTVRLNKQSDHAVSFDSVRTVLKDHPTASYEQREAIRSIATGSDLVAVCGLAGTGKTWMLGVAREVLEREGLQVIGTALAAKAARGLEEGSAIPSMHIHRLLQAVKHGEVSLSSRSVLVVDEAGMVGTKLANELLQLVEQASAKIVLVGDHRQLQAVDAGSPFRKIGELVGTTELTQIIRQKEAWSRNSVKDLRDGKSFDALSRFQENGCLYFGEDREESIDRLILDWRETVLERGGVLKDTLALAGTNLEVRELNKRIQAEMQMSGRLGEIAVEIGGLDFHQGDRIMATRNQPLLNLKNGEMGVVIHAERDSLCVRMDSGMEIEVDTEQFKDLTLGYAVGVYKAQGITVENALVMTGDSMTDRELSYVAASRATKQTKIYSDELSTESLPALAHLMERSRQNEMAVDFALEIE